MSYWTPLYMSLFGISFAAGLGFILLFHITSASENPPTSSLSNNMNNNKNNQLSTFIDGQPVPLAADRIRNEPESVWVEFIQLALEHKPLNLGQGFPDFAAPPYLIESLRNVTDDTRDKNNYINNQYTRSFGHPRLIRVLQNYYKEFRDFKKLSEANEQILITVGAYEALFTSIMAFVSPGDEVIIIEPAFDAYAPMVEMAQAKPVFIPLRLVDRRVKKSSSSNESNSYSNSSNSNSNDNLEQNGENQERSWRSSAEFELNMTEFASKISNKTKAIVLNTPNNPLGKIYSRSELRAIANLCKEHNLLVIADEVYEQMYYGSQLSFDQTIATKIKTPIKVETAAPSTFTRKILDVPANHLSIATMPGMWDRTITIGSAGKTFSVTGWKIGWALGPKHLIKYLQLVHQTAIYTVATPLQEAIAKSFENEINLMIKNRDNYWDELRRDLWLKRNRMGEILMKANMRPIIPQGGYFMLADFSPLAHQFEEEYLLKGELQGKPNTNDYKFVRWLSSVKKLQGIPGSAFYSNLNKPLAENLVRFCFIKENSTLDKLEALIGSLLTNNNNNNDKDNSGSVRKMSNASSSSSSSPVAGDLPWKTEAAAAAAAEESDDSQTGAGSDGKAKASSSWEASSHSLASSNFDGQLREDLDGLRKLQRSKL